MRCEGESPSEGSIDLIEYMVECVWDQENQGSPWQECRCEPVWRLGLVKEVSWVLYFYIVQVETAST